MPIKKNIQKVKNVVKELKEEGQSEGINHRKIYRPWGNYDSVVEGERWQVKRIEVKPGASLSLQMHHHRTEHWIVVTGTAEVEIDSEKHIIGENKSIYIPLGSTHRLSNPGKIPLILIEVQSGSYLKEDDIVRIDDMYGRKIHKLYVDFIFRKTKIIRFPFELDCFLFKRFFIIRMF